MSDTNLNNLNLDDLEFLNYKGTAHLVEKINTKIDEKIAVETERATTKENEISSALEEEISRATSAEVTKVDKTTTVNGKALSENITLTASDVGADASGSADTALTNAKEYANDVYENATSYTDQKIADLINGAPSAMDTLSEIATAMEENATVVEALDQAIGSKAGQAELDSHTGNGTIHITATERSTWNTVTNKVDKIDGKGLSTNDYTTEEKNKLAGLATVATSGKYSDLSGLPTIPSKTSQLTNDSGFKTTDNNTTYTLTKSGSTITLTGSDGSKTSVTDSDTNTTYSKLSQFTNDSGYITGITKSMVTTALGYTPPTSDTNTHYTTRIYAGASGTAANASATSPYIKITDDNTYRNQIRLIGSGATTVTSDANGNITISSTNTDTNTWRPLGTTADTACAGNDSRLSNARPASDVYSWAKASTKPSYAWSEITGKPSLGNVVGYNCSTSATANTVALRDGNGYLYAQYYNQGSGAESATTSSYIMFADSAGWIRKGTLASIKTALGLGSAAYTASTAYAAVSHSHSYAPVAHNSSGTGYGIGNASYYGHVKLSDAYTSSAGTAANAVGASSYAVATAYSTLKSSMDGLGIVSCLKGTGAGVLSASGWRNANTAALSVTLSAGDYLAVFYVNLSSPVADGVATLRIANGSSEFRGYADLYHRASIPIKKNLTFACSVIIPIRVTSSTTYNFYPQIYSTANITANNSHMTILKFK